MLLYVINVIHPAKHVIGHHQPIVLVVILSLLHFIHKILAIVHLVVKLAIIQIHLKIVYNVLMLVTHVKTQNQIVPVAI